MDNDCSFCSVSGPINSFRFHSNFRDEYIFPASFPVGVDGSAELCSCMEMTCKFHDVILIFLNCLGWGLRFAFPDFTPLVFHFLGSHVSSSRAWIWVDCFQRSRYHCSCVSRALFELVSAEALASVFRRIGGLPRSTCPC